MECKFEYKKAIIDFDGELIDTLWNVNLVAMRMLVAVMGINRYIMECKYKWTEQELQKLEELIDTLWNVNYLKPAAANYAKEN